MTGHLYYWVADWNLSRAEAAARLGGNVANMVDCTGSAYELCKATNAERMAGYVTGSEGIAWTPEQFADAEAGHIGGRPPARAVLRIDQSDTDLPLISDAKLAKDIEPGASDTPVAIEVAKQRLAAGDDYTLYTFAANLQAVEDAAGAAGLPEGEIVAYQYASPTSNPDAMLPGTTMTLKNANADLSVVKPFWLPLPHERNKDSSPGHKHSLARVNVSDAKGPIGQIEVNLNDMGWKVLSSKVEGLHVHSASWGD